jgi:hypothetical protein
VKLGVGFATRSLDLVDPSPAPPACTSQRLHTPHSTQTTRKEVFAPHFLATKTTFAPPQVPDWTMGAPILRVRMLCAPVHLLFRVECRLRSIHPLPPLPKTPPPPPRRCPPFKCGSSCASSAAPPQTSSPCLPSMMDVAHLLPHEPRHLDRHLDATSLSRQRQRR